jgi:hypothetical protein
MKRKRELAEAISKALPRHFVRKLRELDGDFFADLSEHACDAAAQARTPYGNVMETSLLPQDDGTAFEWHHVNLPALMHCMASYNKDVRRWFGLEHHDFKVNLNLLLWSDEVQVQNPLRPDSLKYLVFQMSFHEFPEYVRKFAAKIMPPQPERRGTKAHRRRLQHVRCTQIRTQVVSERLICQFVFGMCFVCVRAPSHHSALVGSA